MLLQKFRVNAVMSRELVDDAIKGCMISVRAMQTDHMHPPPPGDGFDGLRDVTRKMAEAKCEAAREAKAAEDNHGLAAREKASALASYQVLDDAVRAVGVDAQRTEKTLRDAVGVITERLRGSSALVEAARSVVESAIEAVNGHAAATDRFVNGQRAYAEALAALVYTKASLVVALRGESVVAAKATRVADTLVTYNLGSMKEELDVALRCIAPTDELVVAQNGVYEACRFVVSVYADIESDTDLVEGKPGDAQLDMNIGFLMPEA